MADDKKDPQNLEDEPEEGNEPDTGDDPESGEDNAGRTYTQEEVDKIRDSAAYSARKKAQKVNAEYEELKEQVDKLQKYKKDTEKSLQEYEVLKAEKEDREMREKVAKETGVDYEVVKMLAGSTEEELTANAESHKKMYGVPFVPYGKNPHGKPKEEKSAREAFKGYMDAVIKPGNAES